MAHPARPVGDTPITSPRQTGSGVLQLDAVTSAGSDAGTAPPTSSTGRLVSGTIRMSDLRERARDRMGVESAVHFIESEIDPVGPKPSQRLADGSISYPVLHDLAYEWDGHGWTDIASFLDAVECEVTGSPRSSVVWDVMLEVGVIANKMRVLEADW